MTRSEGYWIEAGGESKNAITREMREQRRCLEMYFSPMNFNIGQNNLIIYMHFCLVLTTVEDLKEWK